VYLLRLNFLGTVRRKPFWDAYPPTHLFTITPRPRFVNGRSDTCEYGWFLLGPRGEGLDSPPVSGALSPFMKTDAPEPRYERFPGRFRADPLPLLDHPGTPPMRQRGLRGGHHEACRGVPEGRP
jgi:hypothetical protein